MSVTAGELPPQTFPLILANDLIWWFPLLAYLLRNASWRRAAIAWTAMIATGAGLMLLFVSWAACVGWKLLVSDARRTRH